MKILAQEAACAWICRIASMIQMRLLRWQSHLVSLIFSQSWSVCVPPCGRPTLCPLSPQGDSGGPLVCLLNGSWYLVGLTSWSAPCETPLTSPSVFARVSYFDNWIKEHKKASPDPKPHGHGPDPNPQGPNRPPHHPRPPGVGKPWNSNKGQGVAIKPMICTVLLSSWVLLLQLS